MSGLKLMSMVGVGGKKKKKIEGFVKIFDKSYERITNSEAVKGDFFSTFYEFFFNSSEEVRENFILTDIEKQIFMLKRSFFQIITFSVNYNLNYFIEKIGKSHDANGHNIKPHLYDLWTEAIIKSVKVHDEQFDESVEVAWRVLLAPGIAYMKYCYQASLKEKSPFTETEKSLHSIEAVDFSPT